MPERDPTAPLIPWYANGSLAADERARVEEHLAECADCRSLLAHARAVRGEEADPAAGLDDHVQSQLLLEYHDDRDALEPDVQRRIAAHLDDCEVCRDALSIVAELAEPPEAAELPRAPAAAAPSAGLPARVWARLSATLLRPGAALAYLLVLLAVYPTLVLMGPRFTGTPPAGPGPGVPGPAGPTDGEAGPVTVLSGSVRLVGTSGFRDESEPAEPAEIRGGSSGVPLLLELVTDVDPRDLADPDAAFLVELVQGDRPLVELRRSGADFDRSGVLRVLISPERLESNVVHEVRIRFVKPGDALDGRVLFRRAFRLH